MTIESMCQPVDPKHFSNYDPDSKCMIIDGVAYRYIAEPNEIEQEVLRASFSITTKTLHPIKEGEANAQIDFELSKPLSGN